MKKFIFVTVCDFAKLMKINQCAIGSSLNTVVVFNLEVTHAARCELKPTTAINEEPKKGKLARDTEENGRN